MEVRLTKAITSISSLLMDTGQTNQLVRGMSGELSYMYKTIPRTSPTIEECLEKMSGRGMSGGNVGKGECPGKMPGYYGNTMHANIHIHTYIHA